MKAKTIEQWLEWYQERTNCQDLELAPDETVFFHPEHGFLICFTRRNMLEIHHMCGDGKYWQGFIKDVIAKNCHVEKVQAFTKRSPQAWGRKYKAKIIGYYVEADISEF